MSRKRNRRIQESETEGLEDSEASLGIDSSDTSAESDANPITLDDRVDSILEGISRLKSNMDGAIKELEWLIRDLMESQADRRKQPPSDTPNPEE
ncbi:MAG: hypothetical protein U0176_01105 [Bacteroidia bacterium]